MKLSFTTPCRFDRRTEDSMMARHYGFTDEELDFIPSTLLRTGINYR